MTRNMGWVIGGGDSLERTRLPLKFPVNREFTGKICYFGGNSRKLSKITP